MRTSKHVYRKALRTKWPYKKHTHASVQQIYEVRGRIRRKLKVWNGNTAPWHLTQYNASKRISKRVTSGYNGRHIVG
jgi:hypothetical protein